MSSVSHKARMQSSFIPQKSVVFLSGSHSHLGKGQEGRGEGGLPMNFCEEAAVEKGAGRRPAPFPVMRISPCLNSTA